MEISNSLSALIKLGEKYAASEHYRERGKMKIYARACASPEEFLAEAQRVIGMHKEGFHFQAQLGYVCFLWKLNFIKDPQLTPLLVYF